MFDIWYDQQFVILHEDFAVCAKRSICHTNRKEEYDIYLNEMNSVSGRSSTDFVIHFQTIQC